MSLTEQLPEPFKNNEEENQEEYQQVNQQINQQVNQQMNQQINANIETSNNIQPSNSKNNCLLCCAIFLLILEGVFFGFYVFALLLSFSARRYPSDNEDKEDKYLGRTFAFGLPCSFLPCIIIAISKAPYTTKTTFIINCILVLIKTGLFIGYFISLYKIRDSDTLLLIGIFPEIAFNILVIMNDSSRLNNQNNSNQNINNQNNNNQNNNNQNNN